MHIVEDAEDDVEDAEKEEAKRRQDGSMRYAPSSARPDGCF